eukprot:PLAT3952.3.p1 GENE.PLAT3952.3~~PLAT3952.3.p1  ORF type:complete len:520 (-),score=106.70 PLAT3952.3:159-1718(-)
MSVRARYKGRQRWYSGVITDVHTDGSCAIRYDDGDVERYVDPELVLRNVGSGGGGSGGGGSGIGGGGLGVSGAVPAAPGALELFSVGQQVEARYKGLRRWFKGSIAAAHDDGTYDVHYEDGDQELCVPAERIRVSVFGVAAPELRISRTMLQLPSECRRDTAVALGRSPLSAASSYFEVAIEVLPAGGVIAAGVGPAAAGLYRCVGLSDNTMGILSDSGSIVTGGEMMLGGAPCGVGDCVGCGMLEESKGDFIYFTRNGARVGELLPLSSIALDEAMPMISISAGCKVNVNFAPPLPDMHPGRRSAWGAGGGGGGGSGGGRGASSSGGGGRRPSAPLEEDGVAELFALRLYSQDLASEVERLQSKLAVASQELVVAKAELRHASEEGELRDSELFRVRRALEQSAKAAAEAAAPPPALKMRDGMDLVALQALRRKALERRAELLTEVDAMDDLLRRLAAAEAVEQLRESRQCAVCMEQPQNTALSPCGHLLCFECSQRVHSCPTCRTAIDDRVKLYVSW